MDVRCQIPLSLLLNKAPQIWSWSPGCHGYHCPYIVRVKCRGQIFPLGSIKYNFILMVLLNLLGIHLLQFKTKPHKTL